MLSFSLTMSNNTLVNSIVTNPIFFELEEKTYKISLWLLLYLVGVIFVLVGSHFCVKCFIHLQELNACFGFEVNDIPNEELPENVQEIDSHVINVIDGEKINLCFEV